MPTFDVAKILALIKEIITDILSARKDRKGSGWENSPYFFEIQQNINGQWISAGTEIIPARVSKRLRKAKASNAVGSLRVEVWQSQVVWTGDEKPIEVFFTDDWLLHGCEKYTVLLSP